MPGQRRRLYQEAIPDYGVPLTEAAGLRRVVARNPGPMTGHGTNSWLVESEGGWVVVDPGPDDAMHRRALLDACDGRLRAILLTHHHKDHDGGTVALAAAAGAPVHGGHVGAPMTDGATLYGLRVVATPGHTMDHVCFDLGEGLLLSGDHVMGWSTSVVMAPPRGSMGAYLASLETLRRSAYRTLFSAHGAAITEPEPFLDGLLHGRRRKIEQAATALTPDWQSADVLCDRLYSALPEALRLAAMEMTLATMAELEAQGRAIGGDQGWKAA